MLLIHYSNLNLDTESLHNSVISMDQQQQQQFSEGDKVRWNVGEGSTTGTVYDKINQPAVIYSETGAKKSVAATEQDPRYVIRTDAGGKLESHKQEALLKE